MAVDIDKGLYLEEPVSEELEPSLISLDPYCPNAANRAEAL